MALIRISESDDWFVDYDKERGMYRVSYFQDNHFLDEHWFDCYEEKELDKSFPQTIGDITFYSKAELFEWVKNQQKMNRTSISSETYHIPNVKPITYSDLVKAMKNQEDVIGDTIKELETSIDDWKRLGYTDEEAEKLVEASKIYK